MNIHKLSYKKEGSAKQTLILHITLFIVCAKDFSTLLEDVEIRDLIEGAKIYSRVPCISHMFTNVY